jgi:hypothetical protein
MSTVAENGNAAIVTAEAWSSFGGRGPRASDGVAVNPTATTASKTAKRVTRDGSIGVLPDGMIERETLP